jgi:hypothetical protein
MPLTTDDHLLGHRRFAAALLAGMRGMGRAVGEESW